MSKFADIYIDPGIIKRAAAGDARAHEIIYRAFSAPVYSVCLRFTKVPAHAEDLVQEARRAQLDAEMEALEAPDQEPRLGEGRRTEREATDAELAQMCAVVEGAMEAGALGVSTSYVDIDSQLRCGKRLS